jgi:hypothetical protein
MWRCGSRDNQTQMCKLRVQGPRLHSELSLSTDGHTITSFPYLVPLQIK